MPDPTVHPSLTASDTLETLVSETLSNERSPRDTFVGDSERCAFDSCRVVENCQHLIALQQQWTEGEFDSWNAFNSARDRALRTLLRDLYYSAAADQIP